MAESGCRDGPSSMPGKKRGEGERREEKKKKNRVQKYEDNDAGRERVLSHACWINFTRRLLHNYHFMRLCNNNNNVDDF